MLQNYAALAIESTWEDLVQPMFPLLEMATLKKETDTKHIVNLRIITEISIIF